METPCKTGSVPARAPSAPKALRPGSSQIFSTPKGTLKEIGKRPATDFLKRIDDGALASTVADILVLTKSLISDNLMLKSELSDIKAILQRLVGPISSTGAATQSSAQSRPSTYAGVAKSSNKVVIINPVADKLNPVDSRNLINTKLKPSNYQLSGISNTKMGGVVVELPTSAEREKLKTDAVAHLGEDFVVSAPRGKRPSIRLFGLSIQYNAVDLVKMLKDQNDHIMSNTSYVCVVHTFQSKKNALFGAILQVDAGTFKKMMDVDKVFIGWDSCEAKEELNIRRCYKCWGFNHISAKCTVDHQRCPKCGGSHHQKDCDSLEVKCVVCCDAVANNHLKIDSNHSVFSLNCPSYLHRIELERRKTNYGE